MTPQDIPSDHARACCVGLTPAIFARWAFGWCPATPRRWTAQWGACSQPGRASRRSACCTPQGDHAPCQVDPAYARGRAAGGTRCPR
eukprot:scaffold44389_cov45-Phaeocystis_antarctica.AAC.3